MKTDSNGTVIWNNTYGKSDNLERCSSIITLKEDGYLICGEVDTKLDPSLEDVDVWLFKLNEDGNIEWEKNLGGLYFDGGKSVCQTKEGGLIIAADSNSFDQDKRDILLIKTLPD